MTESEGDGTGPGRLRARVGAVLAPGAFLAVWLAPLSLEPRAHRVAAIVAAVMVLWVTEVVPIPVTAMLIGPALVVLGITDPKAAFAPYADPLLFLFYGSFFIAEAMSRHGLDRRLAKGLFDLPLVSGIPRRIRAVVAVASVGLSMWISNSAATAILVPIVLGAGARSGADEGSAGKRTVAGHLLGAAYVCSIGGLGTIVGTPPNLITARFITESGRPFAFFDWLKIGLPIAVVLAIAADLILGVLLPAAGGPPREAPSSKPLGRWSRGEKVTVAAFLVALLGWLVPPFLTLAEWSYARAVERALPEGVVAMLAASLLFILRAEPGGDPVLPWGQALKIDWGLIMLFGGGISLGTQMFETGLAGALGRGFVALTGVTDLWTFTAIAAVVSLLFTEVCSNTATANMLVPLAMGVAAELHVSPIPPALAVGICATCGFALPVSTGPNAIVYGTGKVPFTTMLKAGIVLDVVCTVLVFAMLRILCPLYGWT